MSAVKKKTLSILALFWFTSFLIGSCGNGGNGYKNYRGTLIELDFRNIEEIDDHAWIEIDGVRYTHYQNFEEAYKDEFSIPASRTKYYISKDGITKTQKYAPNSDFSIAIALGNFVDLVHSKRDSTLARVKLDQRFLMHTFGILLIQRPDSTEFTIRTSKDYPVKITVKES